MYYVVIKPTLQQSVFLDMLNAAQRELPLPSRQFGPDSVLY